jgi:quercetin dioxygenase-like cupin family protein
MFAQGTTTSMALPVTSRVLYVARGALTIRRDGGETKVESDRAVFAGGECTVSAGPAGARVLRYELARGNAGPGAAPGPGVTSRTLLDQPIALDPRAQYLMRCDRVDFDPGGEALPHGHRGGGIRCLIAGRMDLKVAEGPFHIMRPGDAWFESGREPVHAIASKDEPTAFIRVSILPREIRGKSSILYVNPEDAARSKPRTYTVFVDDPIES